MLSKAAPEYLQIDLLNLTEITAIATQVMIKKIDRFSSSKKFTNAEHNPYTGASNLALWK